MESSLKWNNQIRITITNEIFPMKYSPKIWMFGGNRHTITHLTSPSQIHIIPKHFATVHMWQVFVYKIPPRQSARGYRSSINIMEFILIVQQFLSCLAELWERLYWMDLHQGCWLEPFRPGLDRKNAGDGKEPKGRQNELSFIPHALNVIVKTI